MKALAVAGKIRVGYVSVAFLFFTWMPTAVQQDRCSEGGIDFQITTDKFVYSPGDTVRVKFLVTNKGEVPLYFFRDLNRCSSQLGSYALQIVDRKNREIPLQRCSSDLRMDQLNVVDTLTNPMFGVILRRGDVYGREEDFELPTEKGTYQLKAELDPPGFTDQQKETLLEKKMRVLERRCSAPAVMITVK
jgi:hypothetical protein